MENTDNAVDNTLRGHILDKAKAHTEGDRNTIHGDPVPMMEAFAKMVSVYLSASLKMEINLQTHDGAEVLQLYKICRIAQNPQHIDSHEDNCAYGAIVGECVIRGLKPSPQTP
jgi:hypothetical protein